MGFKAGDKVRCIKVGGNGYIKKGGIYKVVQTNGINSIELKVNVGHFYSIDLFELVSKKPSNSLLAYRYNFEHPVLPSGMIMFYESEVDCEYLDRVESMDRH